MNQLFWTFLSIFAARAVWEPGASSAFETVITSSNLIVIVQKLVGNLPQCTKKRWLVSLDAVACSNIAKISENWSFARELRFRAPRATNQGKEDANTSAATRMAHFLSLQPNEGKT